MSESTPRTPAAPGRRSAAGVAEGVARGWQALRGGFGVLTALGWWALAVLVGGLALGLLMGWVEALTVAVFAGVLLAVALPYLLGGRSFVAALQVANDRVRAGDPLEVRLLYSNPSQRPVPPARAELVLGEAIHEVRVPTLLPGAQEQSEVVVRPPRRGLFEVGPLGVVRGDPLGLLRHERRWSAVREVVVHPRYVLLPPHSAGALRDLAGDSSRKLVDADLSFYGVREYAPGDALRHVHWKATAKTGQMLVRQYEESQTARVGVLLDTREGSYLSEEEFELAVSCAASLALQAVQAGRERFVGAYQRGALSELPSREGSLLLDSLAFVRLQEHAPGLLGLGAMLRELRQPFSVVTLVTGSATSREQLLRARAGFGSELPVELVRCELHADPRGVRSGGTRMLTVGALGDLRELLLRGDAHV